MRILMTIITLALLSLPQAQAAEKAADKSFQAGKILYQKHCDSCHNAELDPPLAPPMFATQMKYKMATKDRSDFIKQMTAFTMHPMEEHALMPQAVKKVGLMPKLEFSEADVRTISAYVFDERFAAPCKHWQAGMKAAKAAGDMQHFRQDQMMFNRMCNQPSKK